MPDHHHPARPDTDPTVPQGGNAHGTDGHYSGQEPGSFAQPSLERVDAGGTGGDRPDPVPPEGEDGRAIPPEAGHRATVDQRTGEVHGAGAGAGGGRAGEDHDSDTGGSATE